MTIEPESNADRQPHLQTTPLEEALADGDYNNDRLPETPVPGAGQVDRDIPKDPFLERLEQRKDNADKADTPKGADE